MTVVQTPAAVGSPQSHDDAAMRVAVLDVDGTLTPSMLGLDLLQTMCEDGFCQAADVEALRILVQTGRSAGSDMAALVVEANVGYADVLAGVPTRVVIDAAERTWTRVERDLYPFVPLLLATLRLHGLHVVLLSGSPHEMIRVLAGRLGVATYQGAEMHARADVYDGRVRLPTGVPGVKRQALNRLFRGQVIDFQRSYALGDSAADADILSLVGIPVAFEPDPVLRDLAEHRAWRIADRENVLQQTIAGITQQEPGRELVR
ncbi:HAD family phosphatase [Streptomyces sp. ISL-96]|uniref:HAD family hydrolase n=1 Tax=Streptomyces sp. ISL-96 TaxID=2819191 RepID=UPI001BE682C7|nr:haloacid dehalogenase-like hydrolase [Streptomyces sp. ISL-96]MBT2488051.1 HAD family phosphatase [Streptomyces sp. ISL-96]